MKPENKNVLVNTQIRVAKNSRILRKSKGSREHIYLPTMSSSLSVACFLILRHKSMVNKVLELLKIEVSELIMADNITAINKPLRPEKEAGNEIILVFWCYPDSAKGSW